MNDQELNAVTTPWALAQQLYGEALGGRARGEIARAHADFRRLEPHAREFVSAHLLYLELESLERVQQVTSGLVSELRNLAAAFYDIADRLSQSAANPEEPWEALTDFAGGAPGPVLATSDASMAPTKEEETEASVSAHKTGGADDAE